MIQGNPPIYSGEGVHFWVDKGTSAHAGHSRSEYSDRFAPKFGEPVSYRVRFKLAPSWVFGGRAVVVANWHARPDAEDFPMPPPLSIEVVGSEWVIPVRWDSSPISLDNPDTSGRKLILCRGPITADAFNTFDVRVVWSFTNTGNVRIDHNGINVANYTGPNCYNDSTPPYFKRGVVVIDPLDTSYREIIHRL